MPIIPEREEVTICVVGDSRVGKTSFITCLLSESFQDREPVPVVPRVTLGPSITTYNITTHIIDTQDGNPQDAQALSAATRRALTESNAAILMYDASRPELISETVRRWLNIIRDTRQATHLDELPVVVIGNKIDLRQPNIVETTLQGIMNQIADEHEELQMCIETSNKHLVNLSTALDYATRAVLFPSRPLLEDNDFNENTRNAFLRVFVICDKNDDGIMSYDSELQDFHQLCFGNTLDADNIQGLRNFFAEQRALHPIAGQGTNNGLSYEELVSVLRVFRERNEIERIYAVLRTFNYGYHEESHSLALQFEERISERELSKEAVEFLISCFHRIISRFAVWKMIDGNAASLPLLLQSERDSIERYNQKNSYDKEELRSFLALWRLIAFKEPRLASKLLTLLGYEVYLNSTGRENSSKFTTEHNVFQCCVFGGSEEDRRRLAIHFIGSSEEDFGGQQFFYDTERAVIAECNKEKYLIWNTLKEQSPNDSVVDRLQNCNVLCFVIPYQDLDRPFQPKEYAVPAVYLILLPTADPSPDIQTKICDFVNRHSKLTMKIVALVNNREGCSIVLYNKGKNTLQPDLKSNFKDVMLGLVERPKRTWLLQRVFEHPYFVWGGCAIGLLALVGGGVLVMKSPSLRQTLSKLSFFGRRSHPFLRQSLKQ